MKIMAGGVEKEIRLQTRAQCHQRGRGDRCRRSTADNLCTSWEPSVTQCELTEDGREPKGNQMLNFVGVRKVELTSHGVKSYTRNWVIRTKSAGTFTAFSQWDGYSAPRGSGLRANHHYKNAQYTHDAPAVFSATGNAGYVFYGSFELQPGAKITLTMKDGGAFDLKSFDLDKLKMD